MAGKKRARDAPKKPESSRRRHRRPQPNTDNIETFLGVADPRQPHPRDIDQPEDHNFSIEDLGEKKEGENFDSFEVQREVNVRGGATCQTVLVMKHNKPLPMWFDQYLCPRVMPGKWCGYVGYAFRRRIKFGSWPHWKDVPQAVKDEAWADILASWDFRTALNNDEHARLKKHWTAYAANKMRNWRTAVWNRYVNKVNEKRPPRSQPCDQYKWMDPKEWAKFVEYRSTEEFKKLSLKNKERAGKKNYRHHCGSGGYRLIYIRKAKEMREAAILKKMDEGMTRQEAEQAVRYMVFRVDRSIVFLEGNIDAETNTYSDPWVAELEEKILQMNKDKEEGKIKISGRRDILMQVTKKDDHPGRWRGCPTTARSDFALPEYTQAKADRKKQRKGKKKVKCSDSDGEMTVEKLNKFTKWLSKNKGIEIPYDISPEEFLREQKRSVGASTSQVHTPAGNGDFPTDQEGPIPCYLGILNVAGQVVTACAGLVYMNEPTAAGFARVQVRPPIFLASAALPVIHEHHSTIGTAIGASLLWPQELIHYTIITPEEPSDTDDYESDNEETDEDVNDDDEEDEDDDDEDDVEAIPDPPIQPPAVQEPVPVPANIPPGQENWDFGHHIRAPGIRLQVAAFLQQLDNHPNASAMHYIRLNDEMIFGPRVRRLTLVQDDAKNWIRTINRFKKEWINGWQMDMWASLVHHKRNPADYARIQIISAFTSYSGHKTEAAALQQMPRNVVEAMVTRPARLYVMPICRSSHWMMIIISPEDRIFYCIDPQCIGISSKSRPFHQTLLMSLADRYEEAIGSMGKQQWRIVNINHKMQPGTWECGYYCMLYMEKIVLLYAGLNVHEVFPEDRNAYPLFVIEGLIDTNCVFLVDYVAPLCIQALDNPQQQIPGPIGDAEVLEL